MRSRFNTFVAFPAPNRYPLRREMLLPRMARLGRLAQMADETGETLVLGHGDVAGPRQVDDEVVDDGGRPPAHDQDAVGQESGLANAVGDEDDGLAVGLPDAQELDRHLVAGDRVE